MTKHTPATPLKIAGEVQMKKIQHDMTVLRRTNERLIEDRRKLVEALRRYVAAERRKLARLRATDKEVDADYALLRSLGEDV